MSERKKASQFRKEFADLFPLAHVNFLMDARNTHKKPYDSYILKDGNFFAIEHKEVNGGTINGNILRTHQFDGLYEVEQAGGTGIVWVFMKKQPKVAYVFTVEEWRKVFDYDPVEGKGKGVKCKHLGMYAVQRVKIGKKTTWEFNRMEEKCVSKK